MKRRGALGLTIVVGGGALIIGVPMLMVMVLMGGSADLGGVCAPGSGSIALAADTADGQLDEQQLANASAIVSEGYRMAVPSRAILVALAVAHQESGFRNYANDGQGGDLASDQRGIEESLQLPHEAVGSDHGSLGVFQQQWPWWGSMPELMDPATSAQKFYLRLLDVADWQEMNVTEAGQAVQKSAYPDAYADDVTLAAEILDGAQPEGDSAQTAAYFGATAGGGCGSTASFTGAVAFPLARWAQYEDLQNYGNAGSHWESTHTGTDLSTACGTTVLAATDGVVTVRTDQAWAGRWLVEISTGSGSVMTWYAHMQAISVRTGDRVAAGQEIGAVGDLGNATGCHLHFEVHPDGGDTTVNPTDWLQENVGHSSVTPVLGGQGGSEITDEAATLLTGVVPLTLPPEQARSQVRYLLAQKPDVLVLQRVANRDVRGIVGALPGPWAVWQPRGHKGDSAIVWDSSKFTTTAHGAQLGVGGERDARWMAWAKLESDQGTLPVVALDMPADAPRGSSVRDPFQDMTRNYQELFDTMSDAGYPPVAGGQWAHRLDGASGPWSSAHSLHQVGLTTNWQVGDACPTTRGGNGRVDGFAFNPAYLQAIDQGCLAPHFSDHRPVWVALAPS